MKFPFANKVQKSVSPATQDAPPTAGKNLSVPPDGKRQIIVGLVFISIAFLGAVFLLYLTVNAQSAKEVEVKDLNQKLFLVSTEKDAVNGKVESLQTQVGRVIDLENVVDVSQKVHGQSEAERKDGSLWIDRKTSSFMVTLGVLNGVTKGSRLSVFEGENKIAVIKVTSALDVVSYAQPVDKKIADFSRDYYQVKSE